MAANHSSSEPKLSASDPPILLAGLIAARKVGDKLLIEVFQQSLERHGIEIKFITPSLASKRQHAK